MAKTIQVTEGIYRSGRPNLLDLGMLNVKTVICLETERDHIEAEWQFCQKNNIRHINYPLHWLFRPSHESLEQIAGLMVYQRKPLIVHCRRGIDRTGFVIAAYRMIYQDWTFEQAWQECLAMGHRHRLLFWWKKSLKELRTK